MQFKIHLVLILVLNISCTQSQIHKNQNQTQFEKILKTFSKWQVEQIRTNKLREKCPDNQDSINRETTLYKNDRRFALSKDLQISLKEMNNDSIIDALISFNSEDCWNGNGYIGDPHRAVLILSSDKGYYYDSIIINRIRNRFSQFKYSKEHAVDREYITISKLTFGGIEGDFSLHKENDPNCCPSINGTFYYNIEQDKIYLHIKKEEKTIEL